MSTTSETVVTHFDHYRLFRLIDRMRGSAPASALAEELDHATTVDSLQVPSDVVTMNSVAEAVDLDSGQARQFTVVFPADAAPSAGKISVLAPLGIALLGARVGDEVELTMPGGTRQLRIERILFQPESQGRYDL